MPFTLGTAPRLRNWSKSLIKYDPVKKQYTLMDGFDLTTTPFLHDRQAEYMRKDPPPCVKASTSSGSLFLGNTHSLQGDVHAIASQAKAAEDEYFDYIKAVTRSGRDTASRHDPLQRPPKKSSDKAPAP
jgi:hypothetical protein